MQRRALDVSIVIPTYNRPKEIMMAVTACLQLDPGPLEVIVVDDHSPDDPSDALVRLDPSVVRVIRLATNKGQASARSAGFASARGHVLISLDDDSRFLDSDALERVWRRFEAHYRCGVLAFVTFSPGVPVEPEASTITRVADHITCGAGYRAAVLRETGFHTDFLRYMGEESELSVKVINAGFDVLRDHRIRVFHDYDPSVRTKASLRTSRQFSVRNDILTSWIHFPFEIAVALTLWRTASNIVFGLRRGMVGPTVRGVASSLAIFGSALSVRKPIRRRAAMKYLKLRRWPEPV